MNVSIFYDWRDDGDDPKDREHRFRNRPPQPGAQAVIPGRPGADPTLQGYTFRHRLQGSSPADWKLLFQKADEPAAMLVVEWSADPRSNVSRQTPHYRRVGADDPDAAQLRKLAGIRIIPGRWWRDRDTPPTLELTVVNAEHEPARVHLAAQVALYGRASDSGCHRRAGEARIRTLILPTSALRLEHRQVALSLAWNDEALPAITPLDVWRADPLLDHRGTPRPEPGGHGREPSAAGLLRQAPGAERRRQERRSGRADRQGEERGSPPASLAK